MSKAHLYPVHPVLQSPVLFCFSLMNGGVLYSTIIIYERKGELLKSNYKRLCRSLIKRYMLSLYRTVQKCASCNVRSSSASTVLIHNYSQQVKDALRQYLL